MNVNIANSFSAIMGFLANVFKSVISWLDGIIIIGDNTSLLDLNIAFTVFGIIFVAVFSVVRSGAVNSMDTVSESRSAADKARASEARYIRRRDEARQYNESLYQRRQEERNSE